MPALEGCAAPFPASPNAATTPAAQALLLESAHAHGLAALAGVTDVSVGYAGRWRALVGSLQPDLVDAGFRGGSEERLLLRGRLTGQAHTGPDGHKQVARQAAPGAEGDVRVWLNGAETLDADKRAAAALVADAYGLFLLGPMLLASGWTKDRALVMEVAEAERITVGERDYACDVLRVRMRPGLGLSALDQLAVFIDRDERLMRRVRFSLDGLDSTRGAVAEVDTWGHITRYGVRWPTRFHERLLRPLLLGVHDWRLTGLDVNRGLDAAEVSGPMFLGKAIAPAAEIAG